MANGKYDPDKVLDVYNKARQRAQAERYTLERDWFRNVLFFIGIQWIIYSTHTRKWQPRRIAKWVPRPVTNKFAAIANTIMQVLSTKDPEVRARPGTNDPQDVAAAQVADRNFDVLLKEMESERARSIAAAWLTLTGSVIFHPCYDKDLKHGTTFQQHLQCQACGETFAADKAGPPVAMPTSPVAPGTAPISTDMAAGHSGAGSVPMPLPVGAEPSFPSEQPQQSDMSCPKCGGPQVVPAVDEKGKQIGEEFPKGKMKLEVFSPFEFFADLEGRSMDDLQEILVRRRYPLDVIKARFNKPTLEADNNSNVGGAIGLNLLRAIAYAAGNAMYGTGIASGRNVGDDQTVTVDMLWKRPNDDFPQGLVAFYANETLLNDGDGTDEDFRDGIPYKDRDENPIWPWHLVKFDEVPGRLFGKTPMDDVAPKQEQRNKLESLIQLIITRMASPQWLIAKGLGITEITGEAGQLIEGNWAMNPNLKPERVPGENVPTSVIAWLEKIDKDMEELAGTFEVLRGSAPTGVTAGTALRLLLERATTRFTPAIRRLEVGWEHICKDAICIFQQFGTEERIAKIQGQGNTWEIEQFTNADLNGSIDVIVEAGSALPKSTVGEQALIQDLTTGGVINPQDPNTQYKILEKFGSTNLLGDTDLNIKYAQRENWRFINESKNPEIDPVLDSHPIHVMIHKQFALSSDFEVMSDQQRNVLRSHILQHQMAAIAMSSPQAALPPNPNAPGGTMDPNAHAGPPGASKGPQGNQRASKQESSEPPLSPGV